MQRQRKTLDIEYGSKTNDFLTMTKELNQEMECATTFKSDLITHVNPEAGKVDKLFIFGLSQHKETPYKGMNMVFKAISESFQLFDSHDDGRCIQLPNVKR